MLAFLQRIGKSLMLPIATLPAAALLVRLGAEDLFDIPFITAAGNGILENLALIFAIGVAIGFSRDGNGAAALAGAIGFLVLTGGVKAIDDTLDLGVLGGIIAGITAGMLYNRFHDVQFPEWLAFFGGKRFVPIITSLAMVVLAFIFGYAWGPVQAGINALGEWMLGAGAAGVGAYGFFNRLLIPVGLHHVINTLVWFDFGSFVTDGGETVRGEINRFLAGDPEAGTFLAGFFPIMMLSLPAACLAMYAAAKKHRKKLVGGMLFSIGFTSFLTGVTEPIEFSFMFLSPLLYVVHAILTALSMMVAFWFDLKHGFGFSAGFIDYVLNFGLADGPIILFIQGLVFAAIYFVIFYLLIVKLDIKTPGREDEDEAFVEENEQTGQPSEGKGKKDYDTKAYHYLKALGGPANIKTLDYCATRLRLQINDMDNIDETAMKRQGANGVMKVSKTNLQVIVGTTVEFLAEAMRKRMDQGNMDAPVSQAEEEEEDTSAEQHQSLQADDFVAPAKGKLMDITEVPDEVFSQKMMGDGIAIEPEDGLFVSPVDGEILNIFPTKHAIGIKSTKGYEILVHLGLDTVQLDGKGFNVFVSEGQQVKRGDKLVKVDLGFVKENATSTVSPIVFTNLGEGETIELKRTGNVDQNTSNIIEM